MFQDAANTLGASLIQFINDNVQGVISANQPFEQDSKNYIDDVSFWLDPASATNVSIWSNPSRNAIMIDIPAAGAQFSTRDFKYKYAPGPGFTSVAKGSADVNFQDVQISFGCAFRTADSNGRSIMQIDIVDFNISIDKKDLDFDFNWDGVTGAVIGTIEPIMMLIFKGTIVDEIENAIEGAVGALSPIINQLLIAQNAETELISGWINDWEVYDVTITDTTLDISTIGLMYDENVGRVFPDRTIP